MNASPPISDDAARPRAEDDPGLPLSASVSDVGGSSAIGARRRDNEDAFRTFRVASGAWIAIVVDGMGGRSRGSLAADLAVHHIATALSDTTDLRWWPERLTEALRGAHQRIQSEAHDAEKMGAAAGVVVVEEGRCWLAHTGDVRVYRVLAGGLCARLTRDMTALQERLEKEGAAELVDGSADDADARVLKGFLGQRGALRLTVPRRPIPLSPGDRLVVATDGAYGGLTDDALGTLTSHAAPTAAARSLVERPRGPAADDATAVVIALGSGDAASRPALAATPPSSGELAEAVGDLESFEAWLPSSTPPPARRPQAVRLAALATFGVLAMAAMTVLRPLPESDAPPPPSAFALRPGSASPEPPTSAELPPPESAAEETPAEPGAAGNMVAQLDFLHGIHAQTPAASQVRSILQGKLRSQLLAGPPPASLPPPDTLPPPMDRLFTPATPPDTPERADLLRTILERAVMTGDIRNLRLLEAQLTYRCRDNAVRSALDLFVARERDPLVAEWARRHLSSAAVAR